MTSLLERIDTALSIYGEGRELVAADDVVDMLLDIRQAATALAPGEDPVYPGLGGTNE
jgi:hypothetical protein